LDDYILAKGIRNHIFSQIDAGDSPTLAARSFGSPRSGAEEVGIHVPTGKVSLKSYLVIDFT
jgi:hypothetical protein